MKTLPTNITTALLLLFAGLLAGLALGWRIYHPVPGQIETPAAAIHQPDGSVALARQPTANPVPAQLIPPGTHVERVVQVTVKPRQRARQSTTALPPTHAGPDDSVASNPATDGALDAPPCPPVTVDLSLVRGKDGSRVVASSPDGDVVGGLDVPAQPLLRDRQPRWAVSFIHSTDHRNGGQLQYQRGPFVIGAGAQPGTTFVSAGIRF